MNYDEDEDNVWKVSSEAKAGNSINPESPRGEQGKGGILSPRRSSTKERNFVQGKAFSILGGT